MEIIKQNTENFSLVTGEKYSSNYAERSFLIFLLHINVRPKLKIIVYAMYHTLWLLLDIKHWIKEWENRALA